MTIGRISQTELKQILEYRDGDFYWKIRKKNVRLGEKAGSIGRYIRIKIDGIEYGAHQLSFLYHNGYIPKLIDHINRNPHDNRIENLREANLSQNNWNSRLNRNNKSGVKGVFWNSNENKWVARCYVNGKQYHLGYFLVLNDAKYAVEKFRTENHKEFCCHG